MWGPTLIVSVVLGSVVGSFTTTAALRYLRNQGALMGRSRCDSCHARLSFVRTVPILSYVAARGVCHQCTAPITRLHPGGEIAGALIGAFSVMVADPVRGAAIAAIGFLLLALATIDLRTYRLPDALTAAIAVLAAFLGASRGSIHLLIGLGAALFTFLVLAGVRRLTASVRGEAGLGFGDVKLATALALWLAAVMPWVIILASLVGLVHAALSRPEAGRIPFGPSLALAGFGVGIVMEYFWGGWAW